MPLYLLFAVFLFLSPEIFPQVEQLKIDYLLIFAMGIAVGLVVALGLFIHLGKQANLSVTGSKKISSASVINSKMSH